MNRPWPNKIIIGLTGNIATGKSAIARLAGERGALMLDADEIVHLLLEEDTAIQSAIEAAFGPDVRRQDGGIKRSALAAIVFDDLEALRELEGLLHPAVGREIYRRIDCATATVIMLEAIKLLEGQLTALCDQIWVTDCTRRRQIERLTICRGMDTESAIARVDAQNPQSEKIAQADVVIDTNGTLVESEAQFERAWAGLNPFGDR